MDEVTYADLELHPADPEGEAMTHTHDIEVECADTTDRVTVKGGADCTWCRSTAEKRARVTFVSPSVRLPLREGIDYPGDVR